MRAGGMHGLPASTAMDHGASMHCVLPLSCDVRGADGQSQEQQRAPLCNDLDPATLFQVRKSDTH